MTIKCAEFWLIRDKINKPPKLYLDVVGDYYLEHVTTAYYFENDIAYYYDRHMVKWHLVDLRLHRIILTAKNKEAVLQLAHATRTRIKEYRKQNEYIYMWQESQEILRGLQ